MGQFAGGGGVDVGGDVSTASLQLPVRSDDLKAYVELVVEAFRNRQLLPPGLDSHSTIFDIAEILSTQINAKSEKSTSEAERKAILGYLVQEARISGKDSIEITAIRDLVERDQISSLLQNQDELRHDLMVILHRGGFGETAQTLANQLMVRNSDRDKLPELLLVLPDNFSEEAWKSIGRNLGLGPVKKDQLVNFASRIPAAYRCLTGSGANPANICLSAEDAKNVLVRVLSLQPDEFTRLGSKGTWDNTKEVLSNVSRQVGSWVGILRNNCQPEYLQMRKDQISEVKGFTSLHLQIQKDVLSLIAGTGREVANGIKRIIDGFEKGYREEALVAQKIIGFSLIGSREVQRSKPGSIADQFGYDIRVGHIFLDAKSSQYGVSQRETNNSISAENTGLPSCLQAIPIEGDRFRVVFRALPVTIRDNGDLVEDPGSVLFEAIRRAEARIDNLIKPHHP